VVLAVVLVAEAVGDAPRLPLLDPHHQVAPRPAETGARQLDLDAREDAELVEVALQLEEAGVADRLAALDVEGAADHLALGRPVAAHDDPVDHRLRALDGGDRQVHHRLVGVPVGLRRDLRLGVAGVGVGGAHHGERLLEEQRVERPLLLERQLLAQVAQVERADVAEVERADPPARPLDDRDLEPQLLAALRDHRRPHLRLGETLEGVEAAQVLDVPLQLLLDEPAAAERQEAPLADGHQVLQLLVVEALVAGELHFLEPVHGAGDDGEDDVEQALLPLLLPVHLHLVVPLPLVVLLDARRRLQDQRLVVPLLLHEGQQVLLA
jgi:hypothetical protein